MLSVDSDDLATSVAALQFYCPRLWSPGKTLGGQAAVDSIALSVMPRVPLQALPPMVQPQQDETCHLQWNRLHEHGFGHEALEPVQQPEHGCNSEGNADPVHLQRIGHHS
mmetsp:Transcript_79119/g.152849  ORF Transcript_79119/g.152849 Transcript_79119/m.152849 type:complete len:110 (+) Transcript_79119:2015-2344(+)